MRSLQWSIVPFWLQRQARQAAKLERRAVQLGRKLHKTIMGPFAPPEPEGAEEDSERQELSGGHAVCAHGRCWNTVDQ